MKHPVLPLGLLLVLSASCQDLENEAAAAEISDASKVSQGVEIVDDDDDGDEHEEEIPLSEVPLHVKAAALEALPGIVFTEAERETENGVVTYDLEGTVDGARYEVEVTADGKVVEIESEGDDDDDDDDDD